MSKILLSSFTLVIGVVVGAYVIPQTSLVKHFNLVPDSHAKLNESESQTQSASAEPLYWVAPMDPNYRRDKPGKSPMGMDLVPVYAEGSANEPAGTVTISPAVENNLGVRTAAVEFDLLKQEIRTVGYISADEDSQWQLNSRVSGWIEKLYVKSVGEPIQKGQALFELYSPELVKAQEEFLNALRLNKMQSSGGQNNNLISSSRLRLQALGLNQDQITRLEQQRKVEQKTTFYARQSGYLSQLNIREGAYIAPANKVLEVASLETVWLKAELFEAQAAWVKTGDSAEIRFEAFPDQTWQGKVDLIYPELDEKNRTVAVRLRIANPDLQLKPNMFAQLSLSTTALSPAMLIPREALIRSSDLQRVVVALGNGRFRSVKVNIGRENSAQIEVLEGLMPGQKVVTSAQFMLDSESSLNADFSRMAFGAAEMGHEGMDHSTMSHGAMNHENMDHSTMNHETMNHGAMDHSLMAKPAPLPLPTQKDDDLDWLDLDDDKDAQ